MHHLPLVITNQLAGIVCSTRKQVYVQKIQRQLSFSVAKVGFYFPAYPFVFYVVPNILILAHSIFKCMKLSNRHRISLMLPVFSVEIVELDFQEQRTNKMKAKSALEIYVYVPPQWLSSTTQHIVSFIRLLFFISVKIPEFFSPPKRHLQNTLKKVMFSTAKL